MKGYVSFLTGICTLASSGIIAAEELVIYSGRSKSLVAPVIKQFERETGISARVKYGSTSALAIALQEEAAQSPADVFWAQDAGALSATAKAGLFRKLEPGVFSDVNPSFINRFGDWVATSGRARVLAYSPQRVDRDRLPRSCFDLTDAQWKSRLGWAPANASFQAFVTAMRSMHGDDRTRKWLQAVKVNGAKTYPKNTAIIRAIAAGEIDLGLPNHYYLFRFKKADSQFPVEQTAFEQGDIGNLVNVAGVGILKTSRQLKVARQFVQFLLSAKSQQYFTSHVIEYPVTDAVIPNRNLLSQDTLLQQMPKVPLDQFDDLEGTLEMLRAVGLL